MSKRKKANKGLTRRDFFSTGAAAAGGMALGHVAQAAPCGPRVVGPHKTAIALHVNGKDRKLEIEPRVTLLRALRNHLDITGPKEACDRGACGACSVLVDGVLVNSCMMLALDAVGKKIVTCEGLAEGDTPSAVQEAFCAKDALQCGFCTPGLVMACTWSLQRRKTPTLRELKKDLSGNICRCGAYTRVFEAAQAAAKTR